MKRRKDGLIPLHFHFKDLRGLSQEKTVYGKTPLEVRNKKAAFLANVKLCLRMDEQGKTVKQWAEEWLKVYKAPNVGFKALEGYSHAVSLLVGTLGSRTLSSVTQADLQRLINTKKGKSASTISKFNMTIKAVFQTAVDNRYIMYNPAIGMKPPKGTTGTHRALSDDEIKKVYSTCLSGHRLSLPIALMLFAGLRRGEAIGFDAKKDVDTQIHIRRTAAWPVNQPIIKPPKSKASIRSMPIFNQLKPFLTIENKVLTKQVLTDALKDFVTKSGVKFTPHDLRHSFCSLLFTANVDIKTAQLWMGHADPAITMRIYTHLSKSKKAESTDLAMAFFDGLGGIIGGKSISESANSDINQSVSADTLPPS